ncbi:MAG: hypothetical protein IT372_16735 [Polyangiaceae bacterium]|nr:hypothetical protein [Polyangiaceae bacterium]
MGDPAAGLARLMDLHGSVALARELAALERGTATGAGAVTATGAGAAAVTATGAAAAAEARAIVAGRLEQLAAAIGSTFDEPFQRRNKLPSASEVLEALEQSGSRLTGAAARIWEPFGELAARSLGRIRYETRAAREEIAPLLRAIAPGAAQLERLDAAIAVATERGKERLIDKMISALGRRFARRLREAVSVLPGPARDEDVVAWLAPGGWIRDEIRQIRLAVEAALSHEAERLLALTEAAAAG